MGALATVPRHGDTPAPIEGLDYQRRRARGLSAASRRGYAAALSELDVRQVVDGDEVLAWIDSWGSKNEREQPRSSGSSSRRAPQGICMLFPTLLQQDRTEILHFSNGQASHARILPEQERDFPLTTRTCPSAPRRGRQLRMCYGQRSAANEAGLPSEERTFIRARRRPRGGTLRGWAGRDRTRPRRETVPKRGKHLSDYPVVRTLKLVLTTRRILGSRQRERMTVRVGHPRWLFVGPELIS